MSASDRNNIVLVGNAHIDMIYRWRLNETLGRVVPDTFRGVLDVMDRRDGFTYAQSQFALYETVKDRYPELWSRILDRIRDGRWIVVGGKWVESDSMLPGGEALIRQFVLGNGFAEDEMGIPTVRVAWIPDCFGGHCHTTPQIYSGCGIDFYVFNRGCPADLRCFHWKSPDGSRVFAYKIPNHYNLEINEKLQDDVAQWSEISGIDEAMVLYGEGDHGGGPRDGDMDAYEATRTSPTFAPTLEHGTPIDVLERAQAARPDWPTLTGDIGIESGTGSHRGAHISQARIKRQNRLLEHAILVAERVATLGALSQRKFFFPRYDMRNLWKQFLLHQFHDTLPGTLVGDAVDDVIRDFAELFKESDRIRTFGMEAIGARIDTRGAGVPVMVFNPVPWERDGQVTVTVGRPAVESVVRVTDSDGEDVPFAVEESLGADASGAAASGTDASGAAASSGAAAFSVRLCVRAVPSLGFRLYRVHTESSPSDSGEVGVSRAGGGAEAPFAGALEYTLEERRVESEHFVVEWSDAGVERIFDKALGIELLGATANRLSLYEESASSSWHISTDGTTADIAPLTSGEVLRADPFELRVRWTDRSDDSLFEREMVVRAGVARVEFVLNVDWHESDRLLTVSMPTSMRKARAVYEAPYGVIERPADGTFWPMQKWTSREADGYGVAVVNNGIYSCGGTDGVVEQALLRSARDMDPRMDEGRHTIEYAICGYAVESGYLPVVRQGLELAERFYAAQQTHHSGVLPDWGSYRNDYELSGRYSFVSVAGDHSLLSVVKILEGDWNPGALILRIYEVDGKSERPVVRLPRNVVHVAELNHIEKPLDAQPAIEVERSTFAFDIGPHQIRTFRVDLAGGEQGG